MQPNTQPVLGKAEFDRIRRWLYDASGIELREGKESLVVSRLQRHLRSGGHTSYKSFFEELERDRSGELLTVVLDALTTNHTNFMREKRHFDFLTDQIVPSVRAGTLKIWSAACSTGQEPYTIACALLARPSRSWSNLPQILASDLSTRALAVARTGRYTAQQAAELPEEWRQKYFTTEKTGVEKLYLVKPDISRMIQFRQINLMEPPNGLGPFHVIFCRNVMLYFDQFTQMKLVARLAECLVTGGHLFIGHSENTIGFATALEYVQPAVYRKRS